MWYAYMSFVYYVINYKPIKVVKIFTNDNLKTFYMNYLFPTWIMLFSKNAERIFNNFQLMPI